MIKYLPAYKYRTIFLTCFIIVGLVTSKAVMSIGVISMFANLLIEFDYKNTLKNFISNKSLFSLSFLFFASIIALTYSNNPSNGFHFVLNKLPLLVIPLAFSRMDKMNKNNFLFILNFFIGLLFLTMILVFYRYFSNFETVNSSLKEGKAIWVPFNHIRFNLMLVFAFVSSVYLYFQNQFFKINFKIKYIYAFLTIFFFISIHILSVRSALIVLYLNILVALYLYIIKTKNYQVLVFSLFAIITIPLLTYQNVESFRNKVNYMKYDWEQMSSSDVGSNNDSRRIISYKLGWQLVKNSFPLGLGTGGIQHEMNLLFAENHPEIVERDRIMPHNQFLYILIDYGLLGLIALCITLFYPFLKLKNKRNNIYYISFAIITIVPLLFDISLEMQLGITFFALFSSLILKQISIENANA